MDLAGLALLRNVQGHQEAGLPEPEFSLSDGFVVTLRRKVVAISNASIGGITGEVTGEVTDELRRLLLAIHGEMKRVDLQAALGLKHQESFRNVYLIPAMTAGWVEMSIPEKPNSSKQRYRLTRRGTELQATLQKRNLKP